MAISVGSVEVDVIPNTRGIYQRLRDGLVPAATRAGEDAGNAAGRSFGPAMQSEVAGVGLRIGEEIGSQIAARIVAAVRGSLRDGLTQAGALARSSAVRQGDETGGAFSRALKTRLEAAFRSLPKLQVGADTSEADADLQALRVRMETLANKRIGIDIEAEAAKAEIKLIEAELTRLGAEHPNVQVRADTATALTQLAAVRAAIDAVDGDTARVNVNTSGALSAIFQLGVAIAGLAAIPAIPVLAAGIGSIAAAGVAAGVGVGALAAVAIPAFQGISGALQAQKAAQDAAATSTARGSQANSQGASKALQMAGAQQALATAERNGARQIAQAQQQVKQAKQAAADAIVQAAQQNAQAARQVQDAEKALAQSQKDAKQAQLDLTAARKAAAQELQDLSNQYIDAQLSQRDAALSVAEAQQELAKTQADPKATQLQRQQAQLAYDQAVQRLSEQTTATQRLKVQQDAAAKTGLKGTNTFKQAQDNLAKAQQSVADKAQAVRDAQASAAQTQVATARQVAQAQQRVSDATANVAVAQQSAADAVSSAQRQIASAAQSSAVGVDQAAVAQAKYQQELAKLSPAARGTFNAFTSLRTAFKAWSTSLQPQVMPLFTRALVGMKNALPGLTPFVLAAARGIKILQDRVSAGFKSPWWKTFKKDLAGSVTPAIVGLGASFGRIFKGMAGIIQAFLPHMNSISATMQRITGRFATWGTSLKGSDKFEHFLAYASKQGPILAKAVSDISSAFYQVSKALSPLSGPVLQILGAVARAIASVAQTLPWLIQLMYLAFVATRVWTLGMLAFNLVMNANPITLIVIGIVALVAAVIYAYKHWTAFRLVVQAAWAGIQAAAMFAWNNILKPAFNGIMAAVQAVGRWATWLWQNVLSPVFGFIGAAARILATIIVVVLIAPWVIAFKALGALGSWLWKNAIKPAFDGIAAAAAWLWKKWLKPQFDAIKVGIHAVGTAGKWLWTNVFSPVFGWIASKAKWLWDKGVKPAFGALKTGIASVGSAAKSVWTHVLSPVFGWIGDKGKWLWNNALRPQFDLIKKGIKAVGDSFKTAAGFIKKEWDKVEGFAKKPVAFVIDTVYNKGIRGVWNKVASAFGAPSLPKFEGFASGGVLPGYTPGRDPHKFYSPTGGGLELSGGEAIMRPEFTRAVGSNFVSTMNKVASQRGATGVKAALAPALGGNDTTQKFADGGIFGWIGKTAKGIGSSAWDGIKESTSWLTDSLEASARAGVKAVVNPLMKSFPGLGTDYGKIIRNIPTHMLDSLFGFSKTADKKGAGGIGGPRIQAGLKWAKTQAGLPYQWAGNGNPSWDCSGFMSAIESVIRGQKPHRRWATGAFSGKTAPPGWTLNANSPFKIGITNAGVGHTAGTIGGVNVESRGGDGVVVGSRARGYKASLFGSHYGFTGKYDQGGYLQPGMNLAYNGTGRPEPVFTSQQASSLASMARGGALSLDGQQLQLVLDDGRKFNAHIEALADGRVHAANGQLLQVLDAGGGH